MSIRCVCPNGHVLKVKESLAGTSGLCPTCPGEVEVPRLRPAAQCRRTPFSTFWGSSRLPPSGYRRATLTRPNRTRLPSSHERDYAPRKVVTSVKREIPSAMHICPYCHTYIATLRDF